VFTDCTAQLCLHHVRTGPHAATPEYAATALTTLDEVHTALVASGYRPPLPDRGLGGNELPDVYLAELGDRGIYGYCTSDQRTTGSRVWSYCVLDDDYAEIASMTPTDDLPLELLQATAAHEYFHAVQFGYDVREDDWFMEGTATWIEDELFDEVDDNRSYLGRSPLSAPRRPLDQAGQLHEYGAWIFFRHLTERFPEETGVLPTLVLDAWEAAAADASSRGLFSSRAVGSALARRGTGWRASYLAFALDGFAARAAYEEGA
jgi:hypothetical protein